jgi:hypothetical protein
MLAAHPYIGVACSSALRLGLHARSFESLPLLNEQRRTSIPTLITILKLDVYTSLVLGLPRFIDPRGLHKHLQFAEVDLFDSGRPSDTIYHDDAIRTEISLKHLELLNTTASGLDVVFPQVEDSNKQESVDEYLVNIKHLQEVGDQFQTWAKSFGSLLRRMEDASQYET